MKKNAVAFSLQVKQLQPPFSPAGHCTMECGWRASCGLLMALYRIWKRQVLQHCSLIKWIIFTAFKDHLEETGISVILSVWRWRFTMTTRTVWYHCLLISQTSRFYPLLLFCNINANVNTWGKKANHILVSLLLDIVLTLWTLPIAGQSDKMMFTFCFIHFPIFWILYNEYVFLK